MKDKTILVVDDDKNICELLDLYLSIAGFSLLFCYDGSTALNLLKDQKIDLILLDIMLPIINGWEVCKIVRRTSSIPIIMLTARDMLEDKIQGFDIGADDYIVKPFEPKEVIARIKARLKANQTKSIGEDGLLKAEDLIVDISKYEVWQGDSVIDLKPKEVQLLYFLLNNKNIVFSREQLLDMVWNYDFMVDTRTVDVHIKRLREKLGDHSTSWSIKTLRGVGYKLEVR
ncbi:response regulator transcription factor [Desulfosporosinus metallidurans]|uniref:Stage 0 sporulation protein A homolog n=1 Tax=Desulfosporosinus metallidurans TaxID=1888891 RepID=A0A1Q8QXL7_9FIRM|nr:response regulator transcription factor [Desulfosporosinus metallidurans]OLN32051.1 Phosphate regulon transcriptional regulatory protein PhoB (SphR) [Desulfosporosinus metallidurans]